MKNRIVKIGGKVVFGAGSPLALIAGPCVIESRKICLDIAGRLARWAEKENVPFIFKASFDKANRSSIHSFRGPGIHEGLDILQEVREKFGVPVTTDIHEPWQAELAAEVVDLLQIPAFLCRQTDLVLAAGETGIPVSVKKGQFLSGEDMAHVVGKIESTGNKSIILMERGNSFGYGNLVVDMRNLPVMAETGCPVVFDATHSVQRPGGTSGVTGGDSRWVPTLARAAVATGAVGGVFLETHTNPAKALSDKANAIPLKDVPALWKQLVAIDSAVRRRSSAR